MWFRSNYKILINGGCSVCPIFIIINSLRCFSDSIFNKFRRLHLSSLTNGRVYHSKCITILNFRNNPRKIKKYGKCDIASSLPNPAVGSKAIPSLNWKLLGSLRSRRESQITFIKYQRGFRHFKSGIDESQKSKFESRKRNLKFWSRMSRVEREIWNSGLEFRE